MPPAAPYAPPSSRDARPAVIAAYRVFAAVMCVLYVALVVAFTVYGVPHRTITLLGCVGFAVFYAVAPFAPLTPRGWTLGLVAIGIGLTGFTIVLAIPLLIAWLRPTTKAAFRRLP